MKKGLTELVFIIDRSGSMSGMEKDTVGGFNAMLAKQREEEGEVLVSTVLFNTESVVVHDRVPIDRVKEMTVGDFRVGGGTALLDAIGSAVHHIANVHKYAREEDVPEHTIFVITTDGEENSSHVYTGEQTRALVRRMTEEKGWEFIFVAANIDAAETATSIGISRERAAKYTQTEEGMRDCYYAMSEFVSMKRRGKAPDDAWKNILENE